MKHFRRYKDSDEVKEVDRKEAIQHLSPYWRDVDFLIDNATQEKPIWNPVAYYWTEK